MSKEKEQELKKYQKKLPWGIVYAVLFNHKTLNP